MTELVRARKFCVVDSMTRKQIGKPYDSMIDALVAADEADGPWHDRHVVRPAADRPILPPIANDNSWRTL